mgnify:CR=1 FL=1
MRMILTLSSILSNYSISNNEGIESHSLLQAVPTGFAGGGRYELDVCYFHGEPSRKWTLRSMLSSTRKETCVGFLLYLPPLNLQALQPLMDQGYCCLY